MRGWPVLLLVAIMFAGCAAQPAQMTPRPEPMLPSSIGEDVLGTGSIEGVVTDDELVPIVGAHVQILRLAGDVQAIMELESDADGGFLARGLEPGQYAVAVSKAGFEPSAARRVVVKSDERASLSFGLVATPTFEPFHETHILPGRSMVFAALIVPTRAPYTITGFSSGGSEFRTILENQTGDLMTHVLELTWQGSSAACKSGFVPVLHGPTYNAGNPKAVDTWIADQAQPVSPVRLVVTREGTDRNAIHGPQNTEANGGEFLQTSGKWSTLIYNGFRGTFGTPADLVCSLEQPFTNYWTVFFVDGAPSSGWSALPDA